MNLSDAKINDKLKIVNIADDGVKTRLYRMGLKIGSAVTVFAVAPFGTPIGVKFGNIRLAISKKTAEKITVQKYD